MVDITAYMKFCKLLRQMRSSSVTLRSNCRWTCYLEDAAKYWLCKDLLTTQHELMLTERGLEEQTVLSALSRDLGFDKGRPAAALVAFRCCLQWGAFQTDREPSVLDRLASTIEAQLGEDSAGTPKESQLNDMAYWLSTGCGLHRLLSMYLGPLQDHISNEPGPKRPSPKRMFSIRREKKTSLPCAKDDELGEKAGARFMQRLDKLIQRNWKMVRDHVKRRLALVLSDCVYSPAEAVKMSNSNSFIIEEDAETERSTTAAQDDKASQYRSWTELVRLLNVTLQTLQRNHVPNILICHLFKQLMAFSDVQLFNQMLLRPECCSCSNAKYLMEGLNAVDTWLQKAGSHVVGDAARQLRHTLQAVQFLVLDKKAILTLDNIQHDMCSDLTTNQVYRLCTTFWDDNADQKSGQHVSGEVLEGLKMQNIQSNGGLIVTYLLDEDTKLQFVSSNGHIVADVAAQFGGQDLTKSMVIPAKLLLSECPKDVFMYLEEDLILQF